MKIFFITVFYTGPLTLVGMLLCATIIGLPVGILVIGIACKPLANILMKQYTIVPTPDYSNGVKPEWNM